MKEVPWSEDHSERSLEEARYRAAGYRRTRGTVFVDPPSDLELVAASEIGLSNLNPLTESGKALAKHYARARHGPAFWPRPAGSPALVSALARASVQGILDQSTWRNIFRLHGDVCVLEVRCALGFGARWNLPQGAGGCLTFRGFLEP